MKKLEQQYKEETGKNAYDTSNECEGVSTGTYYTAYVEWLEQKLVKNINYDAVLPHRFCNCEGHKYSETEKCNECNKPLPPY